MMKKAFKKIGLFFNKVGVMLHNETPRFFRHLFKFFLFLAGMAAAGYPLLVQFVNDLTVYEIVAPAWLTTSMKYLGAFSLGGALVSKLVVKWEELSEKEKQILDPPNP